MPDHRRDDDDDDLDRALEDLARYDVERDRIEIGPPGTDRVYDIAFARRLRDALAAAILEAEGKRWDTVWVDDMWYPAREDTGNRPGN